MTVDGVTHELPHPFFVVATQNPIEYEGTYPLPEAQLDRFAARISLGYPPFGEEALMLAEQTTAPPLDGLGPVADRADLLAATEAARSIYVEESVGEYVVTLVRHTRESSLLALGASPRAGIALLRMAKARAVALGRDYVIPEDVHSVASAVLAHRVIVAPEARAAGIRGEDAVERADRGDASSLVSGRSGGLALGAIALAAAYATGSSAFAVAGVGFLVAGALTWVWTWYAE